jgi:succinate dehydrogenase / fumarate reductase cytochrome b subunit
MDTRITSATKRKRPVFLDLTQIGMPVGALASIGHRLAGVVLATGVPFGIYLLDRSLRSPQTYRWVLGLCDDIAFRIAAIVFVWALSHHLLAGTRHLLSDVDVGSQLPAARRSAWIANIGGVAIALLAAGAWL